MKNRIVENAFNLFSQYGVKAVTMDDISRGMRISKRTLYEHFDNKEAILIECIHRRVENMRMFRQLNTGLLDMLLDTHSKISRLHLRVDRRYFEDIRKYYPTTHSYMMEQITRYSKLCAQRVEQGIESGELRTDTTSDAVYMFMWEYLTSFFFGDKRSLSASQTDSIPEILLMFTRGISTSKGIELIDSKQKA